MAFPLAFLALLAERFIGYPDRIYHAIGHPVTWIGALIAALDRRWNSTRHDGPTRRLLGIAALALTVGLPAMVAVLLQCLLGWSLVGFLLLALLATSLLAQKSLDTHVAAVADAFDAGGLPAARRAVSMIVGRDPDVLDEAGVCRAAIESLAENFSDGVTAPAFWLAMLGLPGGVAYKAANTADSMIGHRTERHRDFGWAAARFDDLVNLPASRLTALLIVLAASITPGASAANAWGAVRRDAGRHRSPNAGWPEAAVAGALGLALAGPRAYGGKMVDDAVMGEGGRRAATPGDIGRALLLMRTAGWLLIGLFGFVALVSLQV